MGYGLQFGKYMSLLSLEGLNRTVCTPAEQAGYLHDISAVLPNEKRIEFVCSQMVEVLAEEMQCSIFFDYVQWPYLL